MSPARVCSNLFLAFYLWVTACALALTVLDIRIFYPRSLVAYAYGMMAPYQSYNTTHHELMAEGLLADGRWRQIDLSRHYPTIFGEQNARQFFAMFGRSKKNMDNPQRRITYARRLAALEQAEGHAYAMLRLWWLQWPDMTGEYHANQFPAATKKTLLLEHYVE